MPEIKASLEKKELIKHMYIIHLDLPTFSGEVYNFEEFRKRYASFATGLATIEKTLQHYFYTRKKIGVLETEHHLSLTERRGWIALTSEEQLSEDTIKEALDYATSIANELSTKTGGIDKLPSLDLKLKWDK